MAPNESETFVDDPHLRDKLLNLLEARLKLIQKDIYTPIGVTIQTGRLKIDL